MFMTAGARYCVGQLEKGEQCGTIHIQFTVNFPSPVRMSHLTKVYSACHYEKCRSEEACVKYCSKSETSIGTPVELGTKPFKVNSKVCWDSVWDLAK